jgi:hypothetical protein
VLFTIVLWHLARKISFKHRTRIQGSIHQSNLAPGTKTWLSTLKRIFFSSPVLFTIVLWLRQENTALHTEQAFFFSSAMLFAIAHRLLAKIRSFSKY